MVTRARTGRPPGTEGANRARILAAARHEFAARGFVGATLRPIAAAAGVDVALIAHYFGNKQGLFTAALELPERAAQLFGSALSGPVETWGQNLTRGYLGLWEDRETGPQMRTLLRTVVADDRMVARMQELFSGALTAASTTTPVPGGRVGLLLAMSQLVGVATMRHVAAVPVLADLDFDVLVARVAPAVQAHLTAAIEE